MEYAYDVDENNNDYSGDSDEKDNEYSSQKLELPKKQKMLDKTNIWNYIKNR